jgi:hypothetical protein
MRWLSIPVVIAAVLALTSTAGVCQAAPLPVDAHPQKAKLDQTKHADVDGDGRLDTVHTYKMGTKGDKTTWKVTATTATGKTSSVKFTVPIYPGNKLWYGWASLDGHRGAELLFDLHTDDFFTMAVLTWQGNKLQREMAPTWPRGSRHYVSWSAATETSPSGYRFFTTNGKRFVNVWSADCPASNTGNCTVKTLRSVWRNGAWRKSGTVRTTTMSIRAAQARSSLGSLVVHP